MQEQDLVLGCLYSLAVECLPSVYEALHSIPSTERGGYIYIYIHFLAIPYSLFDSTVVLSATGISTNRTDRIMEHKSVSLSEHGSVGAP